MPALDPNHILLAIERDLLHEDDQHTGWATANKAIVSIAGDPFEVYEILAEGPRGFRVILLWEGDDDQPQGGTSYGITENRIEVTLSGNRGLSLKPGDNLHRDSPDGRPALVTLLASLRREIRSIRFADDGSSSAALEYRGSAPVVTPEGVRLDAYTLRFAITTDIGAVEDRAAQIPE